MPSDWDNPKRLKGRAGVEQRKRRLQAEPLCRHCLERGVVTPAVTPDHIIPLAFGGSDDDSNIQCLCADCHAFKTSVELAQFEGASNHPNWLEPSAIPLTIVCGPPCSGKTTFIQEHSKPHDIIIDLDDIAQRIQPTYRHWQGMLTKDLLNKAIRARNQILGSLSRKTSGKAWFIVAAPTKAERDWWQTKLGGEVVLLHPGTDECKRRAAQRGTPQAIDGIKAWEAASKQPWAPRETAKKQAIGADGWPIE